MYDIIGDVHGYLSELEHLLRKMDYSVKRGVWSHPTRKAIFVGDFVNRGADSKGVISLVRKMVEHGSGFAILGNHELNAICYFTYNSKGSPIRRPSLSLAEELDAIRIQYQTDLYEANRLLFKDDIKWLRTLPLFLDFGEFRVAHAYWDDEAVEVAKKAHDDGRLRKSYLRKLIDKHTLESIAINKLTRGIEYILPHDLIIKCNKGIKRGSFRVKWWQSVEGKTFRESHFGNKFLLPDLTMPKEFFDSESPYFQPAYSIYHSHLPFLFVGHYCLGGGKNQFPTNNICCVDSCVASGGVLSAYRYDLGDTKLEASKMISVAKIVSKNVFSSSLRL